MGATTRLYITIPAPPVATRKKGKALTIARQRLAWQELD